MSERVDVQQLRDQIDWYRRCLENAYSGVAVRGLAEARAGYESALPALLARLDALEEVAEAAEQLMPFLDANATVPERGRARLINALIDVARLREGKA